MAEKHAAQTTLMEEKRIDHPAPVCEPPCMRSKAGP